MQNTRNPAGISFFILLLAVALSTKLYGQAKLLKAEVRDLKGSATHWMPGGSPKPLTVGTALPSGSVVQTGPGSAVDISLGHEGGIVRLTQNSILRLDRLTATDIAGGNTAEVELYLQAGSMLGDVKRLSPASKYYVKVPTGILGVRDGQFRIDSQGFVVLLQGGLVIVQMPPAGEPVAHTLNAQAPLYFSPIEGVKSAPPPLVQEVQNQLNARLRGP